MVYQANQVESRRVQCDADDDINEIRQFGMRVACFEITMSLKQVSVVDRFSHLGCFLTEVGSTVLCRLISTTREKHPHDSGVSTRLGIMHI